MLAPSVNPVSGMMPAPQWPAGLGSHPEYDASLLFWRMAMLHIDRAWLAADDPLLFRELQGFCTLCPSKPRCIRDLASDLGATAMDYCPNVGTLNLLEALACCLGPQRST
jgi:hypothetical protein